MIKTAMVRGLLLFAFFAQCAWASEISIKFHENSGVSLVDGAFVQGSQKTNSSSSARSDVEIINDLLLSEPQQSARVTQSVRPTFDGIDKAALAQWQANAEIFWGKELESLGSFYSIAISEENKDRISQFLNLKSLSSVESVEFITVPEPAVPTPSFEGSQDYLANDSNGIYAHGAWELAGGKGDTIKVVDVEGGWIMDHEDFPPLFYNSGGHSSDTNWLYHGTAVVGVVGAKDNGFGITGIVSSATFGVDSVFYNGGVAGAITRAAMQAGSGGVIILEVHHPQDIYSPACTCNFSQCGYVPTEYFLSSFNAIQQAVGNGVIVIEAGGNGSVDLDNSSFGGKFDRTVRDSGAILVGASSSSSRTPSCFTNYGGRIDVHGWGENVVTLSYGDLFDEPGTTRDYTDSFSGTSSASPIVAGAAASVQGIIKAQGLSALDSIEMRGILSSTGTAQTGGLSKNIGELPNIIQAVDAASAIAAPPNDDFVNAESMDSSSYASTSGNNTNATAESGEPIHHTDSTKSIWYSWVAPDTEVINLDTYYSRFDTVLAVYTGTALNNLTQIASNDDDALGLGLLTSRLAFNANAGTTYYIAVDGYNGSEFGEVTLSFNPEKTYFISGSLSLPEGEVAPSGGLIFDMVAEWFWPGDSSGNIVTVDIPEGGNSARYVLPTWQSLSTTEVHVTYSCPERCFDYLEQGYLAENGQTIPDRPNDGHLTPLMHLDTIDLTVLKSGDLCVPVKAANGAIAMICL